MTNPSTIHDKKNTPPRTYQHNNQQSNAPIFRVIVIHYNIILFFYMPSGACISVSSGSRHICWVQCPWQTDGGATPPVFAHRSFELHWLKGESFVPKLETLSVSDKWIKTGHSRGKYFKRLLREYPKIYVVAVYANYVHFLTMRVFKTNRRDKLLVRWGLREDGSSMCL